MRRMKFTGLGVRNRLLRGERVEWIEKNPRASRIKKNYLSAVEWADRERIVELYRRAQWLTKATGVKHVVDHYPIPLDRPDVCGLTVHNNLRVITHEQNQRELNHWGARIDDLFAEPEQLNFFTAR